MTPDEFTKAVNRGVTEVCSRIQDAAARFEAEAKKMADSAEPDDEAESQPSDGPEDQFQRLVDMIRSEATAAVGQLSEGINEMVDELRDFVQGGAPSDQAGGDGAAAANGAAADTVVQVDEPKSSTKVKSKADKPKRKSKPKSGSKKKADSKKKSGSAKSKAKAKSTAKGSGGKKSGSKKSGSKKSGK